MKGVWIACAALAAGAHGLLLFSIHLETVAQPHPVADEPSSVEVSIVESAAPVSEVAKEELPAEPVPPVEATPPPPEPPPELPSEPPPEPKQAPVIVARAPKAVKPPGAASKRAAPVPTAKGGMAGAPSNVAAARVQSISARPRYRSNPKPEYPEGARRAGNQGVVIVAVEVTAAGESASVKLSRSSGFPTLDAAALQAVRHWTFEPAQNAGIPAASHVEVPVRFNLGR